MEALQTRVKWERSTENAPDLHPTLNATVAALTVFGISLSATALQHATGWRWALLFAALTGLITFLIYFSLLLIRQSQLGLREWTVETPVYSETGKAMRIMAPDLDAPKTIHVADYYLSDVSMAKVADEMRRTGWTFKRNNMRRTHAFPDGDMEQWTNVILASFQKAGLVDDKGNITQRGRELFEPYCSPLPAPFNPTFNPPPRRRESGDPAPLMWPDGAGGLS